MLKYLALTCALLFASTVTAQAGDAEGRPAYRGDPNTHCRSDWGWSDVHCSTPRISICPLGDFELISEGCGYIGEYIWIEALQDEGPPIPGIPATDFWLQACDSAERLCLCTYSVMADSATNADGRTTISGPIAGGGCAFNGLYLAIQGVIVSEWPACVAIACRDIIIVSVDLNADCLVNLSDLAVFGFSYNKSLGDPGYSTCCDYNDDDNCNLSDFAFMGAHYLHECE